MNTLTVYKASAGSGKTFTLAAEYIARLLQGEPGMYRRILAVTFTNKATAEMKERILQRLWDLSVLPDDIKKGENDFLDKVIELLPDDVKIADIRSRAADALHALTHDYDRFHVETIDSFFQSLLSNLAHELGLAAGFKVDLDDKEAIRKGVDRLMAELPDRKQVMEWVLNYIQERIEDNQRWDITAEVNSFARELMKEHFMRHEQELKDLLDDNKVLGAYRGKLKNMREDAANGLMKAASVFDEEVCKEGNGYSDFSHGNDWLGKYIKNTAAGIFKAPTNAIINFRDNPDKWLKAADRKKAALVERAERLRSLLADVITLCERALTIINSCELSVRHINPLRLLNEIGHEVNVINEENNRFMLAKTPQLFDQLVEGDDASFIFEKAGTTYSHVMIDEFQDTSTLQWKNFKKLLVENMAAGNGCLLVGDVKQSIYRFRGGDWGILNNIEHEFKNGKPDIRNLEQNFRSSENIIRFNNAFFKVAAKLLDNFGNTEKEEILQNIYSDVAQGLNARAGGNVRLQFYPKPKRGEKKDLSPMLNDLALQIKHLHDDENLPYSKIAILVRTNGYIADILNHFAQHYPELPIISDEAFLLSASPAVQFLIHALRCIIDNVDLTPNSKEKKESVQHAKPDTIALGYVTYNYQKNILKHDVSWADFLNRWDDFLPQEFSAENRKALRTKPLYELCEHLIQIFQLNQLKAAAPYLFAFLDQVLAFLEDNPSDISMFLLLWEETLYKKPVPAGEIDGIRILTIHKSKGLAFHTVLLPFCEWPLEDNHRGEMLWCEPQVAPYNELPLVPVPLSPEEKVEQSIYAKDYAAEHLQRRIENLNMLYVAFTRAKEGLYIWAHADADLKKGLTVGDVTRAAIAQMTEDANLQPVEDIEDCWRYEVQVSEVKPRAAHRKMPKNPLEISPSTEYVELKSFDAKVEFMQSNSAKEFLTETTDEEDNLQETYISQGKLLHRLFANIRTTADIDQALTDFQQQGLIASGKPLENLRKLIDKRMENPIVAKWFDGSWQLFNECTILSRDAEGKLLQQRPDRVMVAGKTAIIVDFKFGKPQQRYRDQVEQYAQLLHRMGYHPISAFLWYVYTGEIEEVIHQM